MKAIFCPHDQLSTDYCHLLSLSPNGNSLRGGGGEGKTSILAGIIKLFFWRGQGQTVTCLFQTWGAFSCSSCSITYNHIATSQVPCQYLYENLILLMKLLKDWAHSSFLVENINASRKKNLTSSISKGLFTHHSQLPTERFVSPVSPLHCSESSCKLVKFYRCGTCRRKGSSCQLISPSWVNK